MDALFLDVGFGTSNIILTGGGEAIVIDAGERSKEPILALNHFSVTRIRHLIVSHWHEDHVGGATGLLRAYSGKIDTVWFPAAPGFQGTEFWDALVKEADAGNFENHQLEALMVNGPGTRSIWTSRTLDADLKLVSPSFMETNRAVAAGDTNATCGILILRSGARVIVFAGDATLAQWQEVPKRMNVPIAAEVVAVPHHAGIMWPDRWNASQIGTAMDNLYSKIVKPQMAVISASTSPGVKHPREDVVAALRRAKAQIMCTQITKRCTSDLEAARILQKVVPVEAPGRASSLPLRTKAGKPTHVACGGSVVVELRSSGVTIHQLTQHQAFVNTLQNPAGVLPLCRR